MNEFTLAARRPREIIGAVPPPNAHRPKNPEASSACRRLADLSRDELLQEALYDPATPAGQDGNSLDDDRLREEVRWRRAAALREPALTALARLLAKVSSDTFETLSQGDINAGQLIDKANDFASGHDGVKVLKVPERLEDHERRLKNLESGSA